MVRKKKPSSKFGSRTRNLRLSRGISQEQLSNLAGINRSYMGQIERGETNPTLEIIERLSIALKVTPSQLLEYPLGSGIEGK